MVESRLHGVLRYLRGLTPPVSSGQEADGMLLGRFVTLRDESAFAELVRRHGPLIWNVCRRILGHAQDAEDAFQATFLVLARKPGAVGKRDSVRSWLYGVAVRVAVRARGQAGRRAARELPLLDVAAPEPSADVLWNDLRPVLDEEINRLPEKYRLPILLCYLEGKTNDEAARLLGRPRGTIAVRLSRGRERLRGRLARRGVTLSGAALATLVGANGLSARLPAPLIESTLRAVGPAAVGALSAQTLALAEGVLHTMFITRLKTALGLLLVVALAASGAGVVTSGAFGPGPAAADQELGKPPARNGSDGVAASREGAPRSEDVGAPAQGRSETPHEQWKVLQTLVDYDGLDDPKTTLLDALEQLKVIYNLTFIVDEAAFRAEDMADVYSTNIIVQPIQKAKNVSLATILRIILARVPTQSGATFLVRRSCIEITTNAAVRREVGVREGEPLAPLVNALWRKRPLDEALRELATTTDFSIVVDARVGEKARTEISAELTNTPIDTAVLLLADMVGLKPVQLGNVFYVTTPENAERLEKGPQARKGERSPSRMPAAMSGM